MTSRTHITSIFFTALICFCSAVLAQGDVPKDASAKSFVHPKTTVDGEKDMLIRGNSAQNFGNFVSMKGTRIVLYCNKKRDSEIQLFSPKASYNRVNETATSNERVNVRIHPRPKKDQAPYRIIIDGVGFDLSNRKQTIRIRSKVKVRIIPVNPAEKDQITTITSKELHYNGLDKTLVFSGDAYVISTDMLKKVTYTLKSDKLTIQTDKNGDPHTMIALGTVILTKDADTATAQKGTFKKTLGPKPKKNGAKRVEVATFILTGKPIVTSAAGTLKGADVVIYIKTDKVWTMKTQGGTPEMMIPKTEKTGPLIPSLTGKKADPVKKTVPPVKEN